MTISVPQKFVITASNVIDVESQFTKAIFSASIIFTDACQITALHSSYEILNDTCEPIKIISLTFPFNRYVGLLEIC